MVEACAFELPGSFLVRENDQIYGAAFRRRFDPDLQPLLESLLDARAEIPIVGFE